MSTYPSFIAYQTPLSGRDVPTPQKCQDKSCIVCESLSELKQINGGIGKAQNISVLLQKYLDIWIEEGYICRGCERQILTLEKKVSTLKEKFKGRRLKRMAKSPAKNIRESKIVKRELFTPVTPPYTPETTSVVSQPESLAPRIPLTPIPFAVSSPFPPVIPISNSSDSHIDEKLLRMTGSFATIEPDAYLAAADQKLLTGSVNMPISKIAATMLSIPSIYHQVRMHLATGIRSAMQAMKARKKGDIAYLMRKQYRDLTSFQWSALIVEMEKKVPDLLFFVLSAMLSDKDMKSKERIQGIYPKIGTVFSIIAQQYNCNLSRVQRVTSMALAENICDQKVYDRLQRCGITLSYDVVLDVQEDIGKHFHDELVKAVQEGKRFRLVGDNINWTFGVAEQRENHQSHMHHAFGSLAIIQGIDFSHLPDVEPQRHWTEMTPQDFMLDVNEWRTIKDEYAVLAVRVAVRHIPALAFLGCLDHVMEGRYSKQQSAKSKVIPLPVVHKNEQKYAEVVDIMDCYEKTISDTYNAAGIELGEKRIHVGGDQLTRERFSGAKCLRIGGTSNTERFCHLGPITFEYFHMMMKLMEMTFKVLYKEESADCQGTMKAEEIRIKRTAVDPDVRKAYAADKEYLVSFVDAYITEALLSFFGMEDIYSPPTKHQPPHDDINHNWVRQTMNQFITEMIPQPKTVLEVHPDDVIEEARVLQLRRADGQFIQLMIPVKSKCADQVKAYSHRVLELGLLIKNWFDVIKIPDRDRGIRMMKLTMPILKAENNLSKYAYEIMRVLVHQLSILSLRQAHMEFYGMFVNTAGKVDSNIPVDERMEWQVGKVKKHVKHMFSNKTNNNIDNKTRALAGLEEVASNLDKTSQVLVRQKKHSVSSARSDEVSIIEDLRIVKPFETVAGRSHRGFTNIAKSSLQALQMQKFKEWIKLKLFQFATEKGN